MSDILKRACCIPLTLTLSHTAGEKGPTEGGGSHCSTGPIFFAIVFGTPSLEGLLRYISPKAKSTSACWPQGGEEMAMLRTIRVAGCNPPYSYQIPVPSTKSQTNLNSEIQKY